jgi:hypothetical protein
MDLTYFNKRIAVSVAILGLSVYAGSAGAAPILSGTAQVIPIQATVLNTIAVTINSNLTFGTVAAIGKAADQATASVAPGAVVLTNDTGAGNSANARIIGDTTNPPSPADITLQGFNSTTVFVSYSNVVDMVNGAGKKFFLVHLKDNLNAPTVGVCPCTQGNWGLGAQGDPGPVTNQGKAVTTGAGALQFHIGGWLSTDMAAGNFVYLNTTPYVGSFDVTLSY